MYQGDLRRYDEDLATEPTLVNEDLVRTFYGSQGVSLESMIEELHKVLQEADYKVVMEVGNRLQNPHRFELDPTFINVMKNNLPEALKLFKPITIAVGGN